MRVTAGHQAPLALRLSSGRQRQDQDQGRPALAPVSDGGMRPASGAQCVRAAVRLPSSPISCIPWALSRRKAKPETKALQWNTRSTQTAPRHSASPVIDPTSESDQDIPAQLSYIAVAPISPLRLLTLARSESRTPESRRARHGDTAAEWWGVDVWAAECARSSSRRAKAALWSRRAAQIDSCASADYECRLVRASLCQRAHERLSLRSDAAAPGSS